MLRTSGVATGGVLLVTGIFHLGFGVDRTSFWSLSPAFIIAFAGYFMVACREVKGKQLRLLIGLGIVLRIALVFAFPLLSDDLYRFLWDGYLINAGENPFAHLPAHYLDPGNGVPGLTQELYDKLNSPGYYTIYPPIAQVVFTVATWLSPNSWYGGVVVMKLFLLACELGSLWLLWQLFVPGAWLLSGAEVEVQGKDEEQRRSGVAPSNLLFYWLNPLIIVEITGNLHFEGAMVFFLLLAYYLLQRSKWVAAAAAFAASVASKLLPLMLLPLLIRRLIDFSRNPVAGNGLLARTWPFLLFSVSFGIISLLFFLPFLLSPDFIAGFQSSLELYQQKFEFNASLYYIGRAIGYEQVGWNIIATLGPWLAKASAGGILLLALLDRRSDWASLPAGWLFAFVLYLLCATTVHPWYLSVPIVLCCFTQWRFPLVWSFLIMLTYTNYLTDPYEENLWLVGAEYLFVLGFGLWEWWKCRANQITMLTDGTEVFTPDQQNN
jgi:alpha-1,6-mannosyltransferase